MTGLPASLRRPPASRAGTARQGFGATSRLDDWGRPRSCRASSSRRSSSTRCSRRLLLYPLFGVAVRGRRLPLAALLAADRARLAARPGSAPAIFILWIPLGFRATCYYYRKAYYRFYFADPPALRGRRADGPPALPMETAFPFILQNLHRYFLYLAFVPLFFLWLDAVLSFQHDGAWRIGLGTLVLFVNAFLLSGYSLSCHSLRHLVGGNLDCFSCSRRTQVRYSCGSGSPG